MGAGRRHKRLDPAIRKKVVAEMKAPSDQWENLMLGAGSPENVLIIGFAKDSLKSLYMGKTLGEIAKLHGKSPEEILELLRSIHDNA